MQDAEAINRVAAIVRERLPERPVVIVSALAKITDQLLAMAAAAAAGNREKALELSRAARESRWQVCDLNRQLPALAPTPGLLVAANVLSERSLSDAGRENLARAVAARSPASSAAAATSRQPASRAGRSPARPFT